MPTNPKKPMNVQERIEALLKLQSIQLYSLSMQMASLAIQLFDDSDPAAFLDFTKQRKAEIEDMKQQVVSTIDHLNKERRADGEANEPDPLDDLLSKVKGPKNSSPA